MIPSQYGMTKAEHDANPEAQRKPLTDDYLGYHTGYQRGVDATASAVFTEQDSPVNDASIAGLAALRLSRKRKPRRATQTTPETTESTQEATA